MTVDEWELSLKTHSRVVNVVMVLRHRLFLSPYYMPDGFGEQTNTVTLKQVTDSLELYLSTQVSQKSNSLQMLH